MEEIKRLIGALDRSRKKLRTVLADLDPQTEICPGWKPSQLLAHIAGWDEMVVRILAAHAAGDVERIPWEKGIHAYNEDWVRERAHLTPAQTWADWENARDRLKQAVLDMPLEKFAVLFLAPWGESSTVEEVVAIMYNHEEEHAAEIEKLRGDIAEGAG